MFAAYVRKGERSVFVEIFFQQTVATEASSSVPGTMTTNDIKVYGIVKRFAHKQ